MLLGGNWEKIGVGGGGGGGGGGKIQKGDLKELKIISVFFLSTSEKHIEKPSIN